MKKAVLLVILALLAALPAQALALGITPGSVYVENQSSKTFDYRGLIINNEHKDMTVGLTVGGDIKQYVSVEPKEITFTHDELQKEYAYQVLVPFSLEKGNTAYILASEKYKEAAGAGTVISARLAVKSRIIIGDRPKVMQEEEPERVDTGSGKMLEKEPESKTTGLVVSKESKAGLFSSKIIGILLLTAGLIIIGGLFLIGVSYKKKPSTSGKIMQSAPEHSIALEEYISKCRAHDMSEETIRAELEKKGWDEKIVKKMLKKAK